METDIINSVTAQGLILCSAILRKPWPHVLGLCFLVLRRAATSTALVGEWGRSTGFFIAGSLARREEGSWGASLGDADDI